MAQALPSVDRPTVDRPIVDRPTVDRPTEAPEAASGLVSLPTSASTLSATREVNWEVWPLYIETQLMCVYPD